MDLKLKEKIINEVKRGNTPLKEIAKKLFMREYQLKLLLDSWGVEVARKRRPRVPMPDRKSLMQLYMKFGNTGKVGEYFGVGINTVIRWMSELHIPMKKMKMSKEDKIKFLETHLGQLDNLNF